MVGLESLLGREIARSFLDQSRQGMAMLPHLFGLWIVNLSKRICPRVTLSLYLSFGLRCHLGAIGQEHFPLLPLI